MDSTPPLPDPATQTLPTDQLSAVSHALLDLAHAAPAAPSPPLPPLPRSSTAHVSRRLAALIRAETPPASPQPPAAHQHDVFTPPTRPTLALELATIHALGVWADTFLSSDARARVLARLSAELRDTVAAVVLRPHAAEKDLLPAQLRLHPNGQEARRAIFRAALSARYGPLEQAPAAAMLVGPPYLLYAYQAAHASSRVRTGGVVRVAPVAGVHGSAVYQAWRRIASGVAIVDEVALGGVEDVRGLVAGKLKEAVKERGLAPAVLVLETHLDESVCAAAGVLRAVCDSYAVRLHVEGGALAMLPAGHVTKSFVYDVGELVRCTHSMLLDIASWHGPFEAAVVSYGVEETGTVDDALIAPFELSSAMALWFLLERVSFMQNAAIVRSLCEQSLALTDSLYSIPHLLEVKCIGCGANVLVSYAAVDADAESRTAVNRAMLWLIQERNPSMRHVLTMAAHENREWLLLSPSKAMSDYGKTKPIAALNLQELSRDMVYAARRCEAVMNGKAAFISEMRQCPDVEVDNLPVLNPKAPSSPLFFAALRVTPFGEVPPNRHWMRDPEMVTKVEKFTYAFASFAQTQAETTLESYVQESSDTTEVPFVCIGPVLPSRDLLNRGEPTTEPPTDSKTGAALDPHSCAVLAEEWDFAESSAQSLALDAADRVISMIHTALNEGEASTDRDEEAQEEPEKAGLPVQEEVPAGETAQEEGLNGTQVQSDAVQSVGGSTTLSMDGPHEETKSMIVGDQSPPPGMNGDLPESSNSDKNGVARESEDEVKSNGAETNISPRRTGFWGLLFGDTEREDDDDSNGSAGSAKALEDDYFRP